VFERSPGVIGTPTKLQQSAARDVHRARPDRCGRRSDLALKHDVVLLGYLENGLGYYRFSYLGNDKAYVGVIAQEVQAVVPDAVTRGGDGYLRVYYETLGLKLRSYRDWLASGAQIPTQIGMRQ
jgi:hypothetical protein